MTTTISGFTKEQIQEAGGYTLGLDVGIASVGAALLMDDRVLGLHVRAFDAGEKRTNKGVIPLNSERNEAKSARRRLRRRRHRLLRLRRLFKRSGIMPDTAPEALSLLKCPWQLRAEGLDRRLLPDEWACILYHIVKHRGFQSTRKSEIHDKDNGRMLSGIVENQAIMVENGYRTVGEMVSKDARFIASKRNKQGSYTHTLSRNDIARELHILFAAQRKFGNVFSDEALEQEVNGLLMQRRPALTESMMLNMIGRCTFEPNEYRAPKHSYTAERFVWLSKLNNLRICRHGEARSLTEDERNRLLDLPYTTKEVKYSHIRKKIKLSDDDRFKLNYPSGSVSDLKKTETIKFFEAKGFHSLKDAYARAGFEKKWKLDCQNIKKLDDLGYALTVFKEDKPATAWLKQKGIEDEVIEAVLSISFSSFVKLSLKAIHSILPLMEDGMRYDEAVSKAEYGYHRTFKKIVKETYIPRFSKYAFKNPVVSRSLNQARKLINAVIREYGVPCAIHIELARGLSLPPSERKGIEDMQAKYQKAKLDDINLFKDEFGFEPSGTDLEKWRLYREQDGKSLYSGDAIDMDRLFEHGYVQIDHALPYSRSLCNAKSNKVLVLSKENQEKGNRTPYEYLGGAYNTVEWQRFVAVVNSNTKYRQSKRQMLLRKDFNQEEAGFRDRNISDTGYIGKALKSMIETTLQPKGGCVVVSGQLTAFLRAKWGLIKIRENGDKHHALDAAIVAACSRGMVKRLSDYSRRKELKDARNGFTDPSTGQVVDIVAARKLESAFPKPWPLFREELEARLSDTPAEALRLLDHYTPEQAAAVEPIRVSRPVKRRGTGPAHKETIYSSKFPEKDYVTSRKALTELTSKDLPFIVGYDDQRNRALIEAIAARLQKHGDDGKKAFEEPLYKPSTEGKKGPVVRTVKVIKKQPSFIPIRLGTAENGAMLRTDVFEKKGKYFLVPVYVHHGVNGVLPMKASTQGKSEDEWDVIDDTFEFKFSLYPNDWVEINTKKGVVSGYYSGMNRATAQLAVYSHDIKGPKNYGIKNSISLTKFHVDYLGRLYPVADEIRKPLQ